ncbi:lipase family protein [Bacillus paralicheniformis]|uniref:lipase family protein n=1 Tax=Bacillus paralicheniformis TaxID=1648923 RepID=UPI0022446C6D|nr:lipase [Bacillus paralicheniformis]MEC1023540.1 lipase [Bacillus paralicheniformis]MEC1027408.1 lipase [Bacillus paralicheniformis]MEC1034372.1 lipase [Bacillus paralicheniformis]MEC1050246.1 lipase [Bacillus paralicheniformis]MEC1059817.1 lipase [Bacillus paralicheniformis]
MNDKIKVPKITDKTYYTLSQESYNRDRLDGKLKTGKPIQTDQSTYWYVEKIKRDNDTGLDAVVFSQGQKTKDGKWVKSDNPKNVVVAFAGTDPKSQFFQDVVDADGGNVVAGFDPKSEVPYIVKKGTKDTSKTIGKYNGTPSQDAMLSSGNYKLITKTSQIGQADDLVREVKQKYKGTSTTISTTGHSLGGAEAEYSAVNNDIYAVAFNNPSVVKLHSEEKQKDIKSGKYDSSVKAIVNPDDMTGSGWWLEYERHAGRTIYTKDPSTSRVERQIRLDPKYNGGIFGTVFGVASEYIATTAMGMPDTHGLNKGNFTFDEDGNIENINGEELVYDKNLKAKLPPEVASGSGAIKVTPEVAKQLTEKVNAIINDLRTMKKEAENAYQEHDAAINDLKYDTYRQVGHGLYDQLTLDDVNNTLNDLAQSFDKKGNPLFYDVHAEKAYIASLQNTISDLEDISGYLAQIAKDFKSKDKMLANWLKL